MVLLNSRGATPRNNPRTPASSIKIRLKTPPMLRWETFVSTIIRVLTTSRGVVRSPGKNGDVAPQMIVSFNSGCAGFAHTCRFSSSYKGYCISLPQTSRVMKGEMPRKRTLKPVSDATGASSTTVPGIFRSVSNGRGARSIGFSYLPVAILRSGLNFRLSSSSFRFSFAD